MKMPVLDFIESKTLRKQLEGQKLPPAIECIFIAQCRGKSLADKIEAFEERYNAYSSTDFQKGVFNSLASDFKKALYDYINYKRRLLNVFRSNDCKTVFRIREIGSFKRPDGQEIYGCKKWEYDAAYQLVKGLTYGIADVYGNVLDEKSLQINVTIHRPKHKDPGIVVTGCKLRTIRLTHKDYDIIVDDLTEEIHRVTYKRESDY